jgi:hypothetical protein
LAELVADLRQLLNSRRAKDGAAHAAARPQFSIGSVDDGVRYNLCDVALDDLNPARSRVWHGVGPLILQTIQAQRILNKSKAVARRPIAGNEQDCLGSD